VGLRIVRAGKLWPLLCFWFVSTTVRAHPGLHHDIDRVSEAIEREPARADLYLERGFLERLDAKPEQALADLAEARRLDPANRSIAAERGLALSALGRDEEAEKELTAFLSGGAATAPVLSERAKVRQRLGRKDLAIADWSASIALAPEVDAYLARGALLESTGRDAEAHAGYVDGARRLPGEPNVQGALIRLDVRTKRFDEALGVLDEEVARSSVKTDAYLRRAEVLEAAGRAPEARADRERALAEAERMVAQGATGVRLMGRARASLALGRTDDARRDLTQALAKAPRYAEARMLLAEIDR